MTFFLGPKSRKASRRRRDRPGGGIGPQTMDRAQQLIRPVDARKAQNIAGRTFRCGGCAGSGDRRRTAWGSPCAGPAAPCRSSVRVQRGGRACFSRNVRPGKTGIRASGIPAPRATSTMARTTSHAARRELTEELGGSRRCGPIARDRMRWRPANRPGWEFIRVFRCEHEGPFRWPAAEIEWGGFSPLEVISDGSPPRPAILRPVFSNAGGSGGLHASRAKNHLTRSGRRAHLGRSQKVSPTPFLMSKVCSITGARVEPRPCHSPPRSGQEKGRDRSARHGQHAAHLHAQPEGAPPVGAGVEQVREGQADRPRAQDRRQERRFPHAEKSGRRLISARKARARSWKNATQSVAGRGSCAASLLERSALDRGSQLEGEHHGVQRSEQEIRQNILPSFAQPIVARRAHPDHLLFRLQPKDGAIDAMPNGYQVAENPNTGLPFLKKA